MKELAELLSGMRASGVVSDYALFGAMAQIRYTEPIATVDVDVLIAVPGPDRVDLLSGVYAYCTEKGLQPEGEAVRVGPWPVQFVPVFNALSQEALKDAVSADFEGVPLRVVRAEHLAALALSTGRAKDFARVLSLLESGSVVPAQIEAIAERHGLGDAWRRFRARFLDG